MFLKNSRHGQRNFFCEIKEECKVYCVKNILSADLLGSQHLLEILPHPFLKIVKNW